VAFQILAYAMEGMTKMSFRELFESTLVHPLNLTRTFLTTPETLDGLSAFIPGDEIESFWKLDAGDATSSA
jgi:CubicO group peptidase (beta-lactamase class C family)